MRFLRLRSLLAWLAVLPAAACSDPEFTAFEPPHAPARSLVRLIVAKQGVGSVIWDAGEPDERTIPVSMHGPWISIPADAEPGNHPVKLGFWGGQTKAVDFKVDPVPALRLEYPRIDHVMPLFTQFDGGQTNFALYVQGANLEVGAVVEVNGAQVPTFAHKGIKNNLFGVPEDALAYPIHHYIAVVAMPGPRTPGDELSIIVRNPDNKISPTPATFVVPDASTVMDSDGDSLTDAWEQAGHDADGDGVNDTDPYRRDIFVELDVMDDVIYPPADTTASQPGTLDAVRTMFESAPFLNPLAENGINLVFAVGSVCSVDTVIFDANLKPVTNDPDCGSETATFSQLKNKFFDHKALGDMYHYVIWAKHEALGDTGKSDMPEGTKHEPADDVIIGIGDDPVYNSERSRAEILAHELGHNLAQKHGGSDDEKYNPNYWSVMSYTWVLRTDSTLTERRWWVTCLPFYYAKANETEPMLDLPASINIIVGYSAGVASPVVENNYSLDEKKGVCQQEVDWNEDGTPGDGTPALSTAFSVDANNNTVKTDTIDDFANWPALRFDGPKLNGTLDNPLLP